MQLRTASATDAAALYALWARAFDAPLMVPVYESDDGRLGRTVLAVAPGRDGAVLASVYWTPRVVTSADGTRALRAGCVANVAAAPEARGRGLVRRALAVALEQMAAAGTDVALLFTGTPGVYRSSGFETFGVPVLTGPPRPAPATPDLPAPDLLDDRPAGPPAVRVDRLPGDPWDQGWGPALPWRPLARLHDAADTGDDGRRRPLATVRTEDHWQRRVPLWFRSCELLTARATDGEVVGYVVLEPGPTLRVRELAVDPAAPGHPAATTALADAALARARHHRAASVEVRLPQDAAGLAFARAVLAEATPSVDATGMLRPVGAGRAEVDALRGSPSAVGAGFHWPGDYV
ncbi:GNAT family N-acetyltransferase [Isoptericola sp. NPDC057559]|uniref:GNAT family N-acetyltransferase n=1 Tax=Isoptericola sp. NPDC057559 TaxID=3346168 RepID=UPI0036AB46DC